MSTNMFSLYKDKMNGMAVLAGSGPCTHFDAPEVCFDVNSTYQIEPSIEDGDSDNGYKGKPIYFYSGINDTTVLHSAVVDSSNYHVEMEANVRNNYIDGYEHIFPNDIAGHLDMNPEWPCSDKSQREHGTGSNYCKVDMAGNFLTHLYGDL